MIRVRIPDNNLSEREYIINIFLAEFLGLKYSLNIDKDISGWEIELENKNELMIQDHFFSKFPKDLEYLNKDNIPQKVVFAKNEFVKEKDIPVIYGTNYLKIDNQCPKSIVCGIDIFASSFFMLTRWEEYVNKVRDKHNRFPGYASIAYKNNFLDRPVVNEYIEMLWSMLKFLGCTQERKKRKFQFLLTHDVDTIYKYPTLKNGLKEIIGDVAKRKNLRLALSHTKDKLKVHMSLQKDPFDSYDYLMDISENIGTKSYFFLHSSNSVQQDVNNDRFLRNIANKIISRGHFLGYHPSYNAYNNYKLFIKDKERIESIVGQKLEFGRQHFLRFEVPTTWQIWEKARMEWDSTLSYADREGFRCGVCYPYSTFNILSRRKLHLKERPLIVMDGTFVTYQPGVTPEMMERKIKELINKVKKYNGEFVILWHNSSFTGIWNKYKYIYEKLIKENA